MHGVEICDHFNERAIHKAAKFGHVDIVRLLVKKEVQFQMYYLVNTYA